MMRARRNLNRNRLIDLNFYFRLVSQLSQSNHNRVLIEGFCFCSRDVELETTARLVVRSSAQMNKQWMIRIVQDFGNLLEAALFDVDIYVTYEGCGGLNIFNSDDSEAP
jgi:hypothetical protein